MTALDLARGPLALLASGLVAVWLLTLTGLTAAAVAVVTVAGLTALTVTAAPAAAGRVGYRPRHAAPGRYLPRHLAAPVGVRT